MSHDCGKVINEFFQSSLAMLVDEAMAVKERAFEKEEIKGSVKYEKCGCIARPPP